jgi:hypothetical protein
MDEATWFKPDEPESAQAREAAPRPTPRRSPPARRQRHRRAQSPQLPETQRAAQPGVANLIVTVIRADIRAMPAQALAQAQSEAKPPSPPGGPARRQPQAPVPHREPGIVVRGGRPPPAAVAVAISELERLRIDVKADADPQAAALGISSARLHVIQAGSMVALFSWLTWGQSHVRSMRSIASIIPLDTTREIVAGPPE